MLKITDDFHGALLNLNMTKGELCSRLGLTKDAPRRWPGRWDCPRGAPRYVMAYLDALLEIRRLSGIIEEFNQGNQTNGIR